MTNNHMKNDKDPDSKNYIHGSKQINETSASEEGAHGPFDGQMNNVLKNRSLSKDIKEI